MFKFIWSHIITRRNIEDMERQSAEDLWSIYKQLVLRVKPHVCSDYDVFFKKTGRIVILILIREHKVLQMTKMSITGAKKSFE